MNEIEKKFFEDILPLYEPLYYEYTTKMPDWERDNVFVPRVGKNYPKRKGILFVGRAPNGTSLKLRDFSDSGKFCPIGVMNYLFINSLMDICFDKCSSFWNVVRTVSYRSFPEEYWKEHPDEEWNDYIAYSNLYLIQDSDDGKNPEGVRRSIQFQFCDEILNQEIKLLSPKYVIFLTGWDLLKDFSIAKTMPSDERQITKANWDSFEAKKWVADGITYILTEHPWGKGKGQETHVRALLNLMQG